FNENVRIGSSHEALLIRTVERWLRIHNYHTANYHCILKSNMLTLMTRGKLNVYRARTDGSLLPTKMELHTYWLAKAVFSVLYPQRPTPSLDEKGKQWVASLHDYARDELRETVVYL
ncbi:hypothetical protein X777_00915, partial [Ooceraea biroi]